LQTSSGETEVDRFSKRENLIEGIGVYALIHFAMWILIGIFDLQMGIAFIGYIGYGLMGVAGLYVIFISPYLHADGWHGWGFSKPLEAISLLKHSTPRERNRLLVSIIILGIITACFILPVWPYVLIRFGLRGNFPDMYVMLTTTPTGTIIALLTGVLLYFVLTLFIIRWDNLFSALKKLIPLALGFWGCLILTGVVYALVLDDWSRFTNFQFVSSDENSLLTHSFFYMLWGTIQQWLFLGYFNTRLRKGIPAGKIGPFSGKFICALLTGFFFGILHAPYWEVVIVTFIGGCFFGLFYQDDRLRNLFFSGLAHGIGATLLNLLTPIILAAGPW
jgi:membrane protease YdiL (CAAX protease family)